LSVTTTGFASQLPPKAIEFSRNYTPEPKKRRRRKKKRSSRNNLPGRVKIRPKTKKLGNCFFGGQFLVVCFWGNKILGNQIWEVFFFLFFWEIKF
jgi:hypothetical protein